MAEDGAPSYPIKSVDRALTLLLMFQSRASITVSEASEELRVARSTAHRLLSMLEYHRLVQQQPGSRAYVGGPALVQIGMVAIRHIDIRGDALAAMRELVEQVGETAHLVVLQGRDALFLDCVEGTSALRAAPRTGTSLPAHCTAGGKALLAALPEETLDALYGRAELTGLTSDSITDVDQLERELALVRERGYAMNHGESEQGLYAAAAAIPSAAAPAPIRAAFTVAGPQFRMDDERLTDVGEAVRAAARRVAKRQARATA